MLEFQEAINDINENMQKRDEELLKVRIQMTQVDLERQKLESELQILRKLIGKQGRGKSASQQPPPPKQAQTPSKDQKQAKQEEPIKKKLVIDANTSGGEDMYFNLASVDQSHDEFMTGSQTQLPAQNSVL